MQTAQKKGIWLDQVQRQEGANLLWLLRLAVALFLCWAVTVLTLEIAGLTALKGAAAMPLTGTLLCIVYALLLKASQQKWFYPGLLMLVLVLAVFLRGSFLEGTRLLWNRLSYCYTCGTGQAITMLSRPDLGPEATASVSVAAAAMGCGAAALSCALSAGGGWLAAAVLPGLLLAGIAGFQTAISNGCLLLVMGASMLALLSSGWGSRRETATIALSWATAAVVVLMLAAVTMMPAVQQWCSAYCDSLHRLVHAHRYETEYSVLPEGDFTQYKEKDADEKTVLTVTMEKPQTLYLRAFTGAEYTGMGWKPIDNRSLGENRELLYWLNGNAFHPAAQYGAAATLLNLEQNRVTVQNVLECSAYAYVPFGVYADSCRQLLPERELRTDTVQGKGQRTFLYSVVAGGSEELLNTLNRLQQDNTEAFLTFRRAESAYREYVYSHYLHVPSEASHLLQERWDACAAGYGDLSAMNAQQAQECALYFLGQCFPEEGTEEMWELPLDTARGTTYQYATVAALTLRYYGVPARYAEGYVISAEMAASAGNNGTVNVPGSCAGAWVEVYQDGIGWMPIDLTPGMGQTIQEQPYTSALTDNSDLKQGSRKEEKEKEEKIDQPQGGTLVMLRKIFDWTLLLLPLLLAAVILGLIFRKKYLDRKRLARFQSDDRSDAVAWIFRCAAQVMVFMGLDRGNGSMLTLCADAQQRFGPEYRQKLERMNQMNGQAVFSSRPLGEAERQEALEFYTITLEHLKKTVHWTKRLWMQWVLCIY